MNIINETVTDNKQRSRKYRQVIFFLPLLSVFILFLLSCMKFSADPEKALWPEEGSYVVQDGNLVVDISNISQGYFFARVAWQTSSKLKLRVVIGNTTLDYDLPGTGDSIVVPLQMGTGYYEATLYENVSGKKYAAAGYVGFWAELEREDIAFLYPNQYVDYDLLSKAVEQAEILCAGKSDRDVYNTVCKYVTSSFVYDFIKALSVKPGMLPDIEETFQKKMGVCQDLSAVTCCMLRTQGIPARLIIGYADDNYHAWVVTELDGEELFFDPTAELNAISKVLEYTVERFY